MKELKNFIIIIFGVCLTIITSIAVMIKGWGLKPCSWWWIIGVYLIGTTIAQILVEVGKK